MRRGSGNDGGDDDGEFKVGSSRERQLAGARRLTSDSFLHISQQWPGKVT